MKRWLTIVLLSLSLASCQRKAYLFSTFREPATEGLRFAWSKDGYTWKDIDHSFLKPTIDSLVMRDPSIIEGRDGRFHLVFTSGWKGTKTFGYASSTDLVHWTVPHPIPVMQHEPATVNVWAPELFYDEEQGDYLIFWASTIPFRFSKGIEDEYNNHRMYYVRTRDFQSFSETKLFYDPGFSVIDCQLLRRGKEDYVLILKDNTRPNRNVRIAFGKSPLGPFTRPSEPVTPGFTEGPAVVQVKSDYLIYFDQYREKIYGAVKTRDFISFTNVTGEVQLPPGHKHGTIIRLKKKYVRRLIQSAANPATR